MLKTGLLIGGFVVMLVLRVRLGGKGGRFVRGLRLCSPGQLNSQLHGWAVRMRGIQLGEVWIPERLLSEHFLITGSTRSGKSMAIRHLLEQIAARGETAIVIDPESEFVQEFYDETRGDYLLNPLDARCPYWSPWLEFGTETYTQDVRGLATSMIRGKDFFVEAGRTLLTTIFELLREQQEPRALLNFTRQPLNTMVQALQGTAAYRLISPQAVPQSMAILGTLAAALGALAALPERSEAKKQWSIREWSQKPQGWLFLASQQAQRETTLPLHGLWLDCLVRQLLSRPIGSGNIWIVVDEVASLGEQPQLEYLVTRGAKRGLCVLLACQNIGQLRMIYGHDRTVSITSSPTTKVFLRSDEVDTAEWISRSIGEYETDDTTYIAR